MASTVFPAATAATPSGPLAWTVISRVSTSGTSVSFTGLSGYKSYRILGAGLKTDTPGTDSFRIRLNNDSSSIYSTFGLGTSNGAAAVYQAPTDNGIWGGVYSLAVGIGIQFDCIIQAADQATMKIANTNFYSNSATANYYQNTTNVPLGVITSISVAMSTGTNSFTDGTLTLLGGN
jgi:hypothetical protein